MGRDLAGKFRLLTYLGGGGAGTVYAADHKDLGRKVAVKVLRTEAGDMWSPERFIREARLASSIDHLNVVSVLDFGESDGLLYLVMELLSGASLAQRLQDTRVLPGQKVKEIAMQVLAGLAAAHDREIVHRDLKPQNIMLVPKVSDEGQDVEVVKVCDFGLAKPMSLSRVAASSTEAHTEDAITIDGLIVGTPAFLAPEQALGEDIDARTDLYACGVLMYLMATGQLPFDAPKPEELLMKHLNEPPVPPTKINTDLDPELESIIMWALKKNPSERPVSAREMRAALRDMSQAQDLLEITTRIEISRPSELGASSEDEALKTHLWERYGLRYQRPQQHPFWVRDHRAVAMGPLSYPQLMILLSRSAVTARWSVSLDNDAWVDASRFLELTGQEALLPWNAPPQGEEFDLASASVIRVIGRLALSRATARAVFVRDASYVELIWGDGEIRRVLSSDEAHFLPALLIEKGVLRESALPQLVYRSIGQRRTMLELVSKALAPERLARAVMRARLSGLVGWSSGRAVIDHASKSKESVSLGPVLSFLPGLLVTPQAVLQVERAVLPQLERRLSLASDPMTHLQREGLGKRATRFVERALTASKIVDALSSDAESRASQKALLYTLLELGMVRFE